uniref:CLASP_N domain-containing protein n=1 Tax=Heligmosomoides polygyrus TaxID=6339 RepID=A0A183FLM2_HELPZ
LRSLVTSLPCEERYLRRLCTGIANHEQDLGRIMSLKSEVRADISCALAKGLLLRGNDKGLAIFEELLERLCKADPGDRELLCDQLNELFDFDSPASDPARCLFRTTFLWRQSWERRCNATASIAFEVFLAASSAPATAQRGLLFLFYFLKTLLRKACLLIGQAPTVFIQFLPVFLVALSTEKHVDFAVLSALPRFISAVSEEKIGAVDGLAIVDALTRTISAETTPMAVVLDCLESLEVIARRLQHCISGKTVVMVAGATTNALGHTKRVVRQKAAAVRNTW